MAALFFLAFAYFAVGQASVTRNSAQTAADAAALAAARQERNDAVQPLLAALQQGDIDALARLLASAGADDAAACGAAYDYARANGAQATCAPAAEGSGYTVDVTTDATVGSSVVPGTEAKHAHATATALVKPRCGLDPNPKDGHKLRFTCDDGPLTVDPTTDGFTLDVADFYAVRLSK